MDILKIANACVTKAKKGTKKLQESLYSETQDERIRLTGVEVLPPSVDSTRVTAVLSGEKEIINRTKVQLYTIIAAFRDEKGTDVEVYDSGNMFVMRFDNSCAAEFVREFINNCIEK